MNLPRPEMPAPPEKTAFFSDQNHWRFGWGKGLYNFQEQDKPLWTTFGPCSREPKSFDAEMALTARKIADTTTKPLYVTLNGAINFELLARIFLQERISFTPLLTKFKHDYNQADMEHSLAFCKKHDLTPAIMEIDIIAFLKECTDTPYTLSNGSHLLQMQQIRYITGLGGMAITGAGDRYITQNGKVFFSVTTNETAVAHCMQAENLDAVAVFFRYTPELMLSELREVKMLDPRPLELAQMDAVRETVYQKFWPDLTSRPPYYWHRRALEQRLNTQMRLESKNAGLIYRLPVPMEELESQLSKGLNPSIGA